MQRDALKSVPLHIVPLYGGRLRPAAANLAGAGFAGSSQGQAAACQTPQ